MSVIARLTRYVRASIALAATCVASQAASPYGPFGAGLPDDGYGPLSQFPTLFRWMIEAQAWFDQRLETAVRAVRHDPAAAWPLVALSFLYGVLHAIGPGHGKAVLSSYVLADRQTLRNGLLLAFVAALAQALGAICLVAVANLLLHMTSVALTTLTYRFEIGSDALIVGLGLWMVREKVWIRRFDRTRAVMRDASLQGALVGATVQSGRFRASAVDFESSSAAEGDLVDCECGELHLPSAAQASALDWRKAWGIVGATALRPCTGALIVLVFARVEGVFLMGVAAVLAMGLGVALTVGALAVFAASMGRLTTGGLGSRPRLAQLKTIVEVAFSFAILFAGLAMLALHLDLASG